MLEDKSNAKDAVVVVSAYDDVIAYELLTATEELIEYELVMELLPDKLYEADLALLLEILLLDEIAFEELIE
jgi:hypothetical protein